VGLVSQTLRTVAQALLGLRLKVTLSCAVLFSLGLVPASFALNPQELMGQFTHTSWTVKEGIPGPVRAIAQTSDGYLWLATEAGLYRFDGVHFVAWKPREGEELPGSGVTSLCLGHDGSLWIGFRNGAISRISNGQLHNFLPAPGSPRGKILSMAEDGDGVIWAAGQYAFGRIENGEWRRTGADEGYVAPAAQWVTVDRWRNVWVATDGYNFGSASDTLRRNTVLVLRKGEHRFAPTGAAVSYVPQIAEAPDGSIWITEQIEPRIIRIAAGTGRMDLLKGNFIWPPRVLFDRDNSVWVGLDGGGLRRFSDFRHPDAPMVDKFVPGEGLSGGVIYSSFEDREGNVWFGTEGGLDRFSENKLMLLPAPESFHPGNHMGLNSTADGTLWMYEYANAGIYRYRAEKFSAGKWPANVPSGRRILSIYAEDGRTAWLGGDFGLAHVVDGKISFLPIADNLTGGPVEAIAKAADGSLWISFWAADSVERPMRLLHGVWTDFRKSSALPKYRCRVLHGDSAGRMWLGYEDGEVAVYENGSFHVYSSKDGLTGGQINTIYEDSNRHTWIGSDGGVSRFDSGRFVTLTAKNGLPGRSIAGVLEDGEGFVWLTGSTGILRAHASELNKAFDSPAYVKGTLLDAGDGLRAMPRQGEPFPTMTRTPDGRLWFSTTNGVFMLDPRHLPQNLVPPPVAIEEFRVDGRSLLETDAVNKLLRPNAKILRFDYTALSLTAPERVRFRYRLEGFDPEWSAPVTSRQAMYTNLPPRDYRFRVIACNNDGVWNETGASLKFTILPAFYQTTWFFLLCITAIGCLTWVAYRRHLRQVSARLSLIFKERLSERTRIARELHDTLLQSFQGLILHFQRARNLLPERASEAIQMLDRALDGAEQAVVEGRDAIHDLRSPVPAAHGLAEEITSLGEELIAKDGNKDPVQFRAVIEGTAQTLNPNVHIEIFRIAREALRNAFSHSQARRIETEVAYSSNLFRLRIRDDGKGMAPDVRNRGERIGHWGLGGMRERAERLGGKLEVWSEPGAGTEVDLRVPASIAYQSSPARNNVWLFWKKKKNDHEDHS
jgi:signal transduction histidine kinase/ligand-binding sensor domain-containing protein